MKLCIIGTSHVAALKSHVDRAVEMPWRCEYFAARGSAFLRSGFTLADGRVTPDAAPVRSMFETTSPDGSGAIEAARYDAFLLTGIPVTYFQNLLCAFAPEAFFERGVHQRLLARQLYEVYLIEQKVARVGLGLIRQLASAKSSDARIFVTPAPALTRAQFDKRFPALAVPSGLRAQIVQADSVLTRWFAARAIEYLPQPDATLGEDGFSLPCLAQDETHMTADYGAAVLSNLPL